MNINDKLNSINEELSFPVTIITLVSGVIAIFNDAPWFISLILFTIFIIFIIIIVLNRNQYSDFEVLNQDEIVDLRNYHKNIAEYSINCNYKSLKTNAQNIKMSLTITGELSKPKLEKGVVKEIKHEGGTYYLNILTDKAIGKGAQYNNKLNCKLKDTFNEETEFWEINKFSKSSNIKLTVIFPKKRGPKTAQSFDVKGHIKKVAKIQPRIINIGKNRAILFEVRKMKPLEKYRVEWTW